MESSSAPTFGPAREDKSPSFSQLAEAYYDSLSAQDAEPSDRARPTYYAQLVKDFEATHGTIVDSHFCRNVQGTVVLTSGDHDQSDKRAEGTHQQLRADRLALARDLFTDAEDYYLSATQRRARTDYFMGMLVGILVLGAAGTMLRILLNFWRFQWIVPVQEPSICQ